MRVVPAIPQAVPIPSLAGLAWMGFELCRMRRITAGLGRARARSDEAAAERWLARADRALADLDRAQARMRPRRMPRRLR
ncbi:hypothetical protein [Methylobacterium sp. 37f]|uniref:hypothetical protein n=1 Tax=Methylobacterium sp. 37f TaxID=2817058 RepID=UPI001FFC720F|nr:hypothetical protein [Methylobacterium sp. 37f]MCK2056685.1 hypothetical protein [Methylobacterium sp. 37f]